ncbi:MAG: hypothetical protein U9P36_00055 [Thermodesulfobacteriota bacterium]|nr:hypothetical protein [Thermodesulfobacteriota bacterium]
MVIGEIKTAVITYLLVPEISDASLGKAALQGFDQQLYFPGKTEFLTINTDLHHQATLGDDAGLPCLYWPITGPVVLFGELVL